MPAPMSWHRGWDLIDPALGPAGGWCRARWTENYKNFSFSNSGISFSGRFREWVFEEVPGSGEFQIQIFDRGWTAVEVMVTVPGADGIAYYA